MRINKLLLGIFLLLVIDTGCIPVPHTRYYCPLKWEEPLFKASNKGIFPSDVRKNPEKYKEVVINWFGVIDSSKFSITNDTIEMTLYLEQKYYNYIEDFSIQKERIFLSPLGEGKFIFKGRKCRIDPELEWDKEKEMLKKIAKKGNLAICYGKVMGLNELNQPIISKGAVRFVHEKWYSTNIATYKVKRDSMGKVILNKRGCPEIEDFKFLKIPGPGKND